MARRRPIDNAGPPEDRRAAMRHSANRMRARIAAVLDGDQETAARLRREAIAEDQAIGLAQPEVRA
jgi:hypothetical protein